MSDEAKQNNDQQEQSYPNENKISSLFEQILEQLISLRQDDLELIEQLTFLYDRLCHIRQALTNSQGNSTTDISLVPLRIDSPSSNRYPPKARSDSEPNILSDRQRFIAVIEDFE